ncbi:MAG TPA: topoisomerase C-terminal repeat-containing protein, partial [Thermosynechococcaceae cyanobacterium]
LLALPRTLGVHPETGGRIQASLGRFGPYILHDQGKDGKEYRSLKAGDDVLEVALDRALALLAEPKTGRGKRVAKPLRELGDHPTDSEPVNIYDGPYGPYIKHGKVNASLPEGQTVEAITMAVALEALEAKAGTKTKSGGRRKTSASGETASKASKTKTTAKKTATRKTTTQKAATSTRKKASTT